MNDKKHDSKQEQKLEHKAVRREAFKKLAFFFAILLLIVNTVQLTRFGGIVERVDQYNKGVVDELGSIKKDIYSFGTDLNEIRQFLLLPTKKYSFDQDVEQGTTQDEKENSRTSQAVYAFLDKIIADRSLKENSQVVQALADKMVADTSFQDALAKAGIKLGKSENLDAAIQLKLGDENGSSLFALILGKSDQSLKVQSALGIKPIMEKDYEKQKSAILDYVTSQKANVIRIKTELNSQQTALTDLIKSKETGSALSSRKITYKGSPEEKDDTVDFIFQNSEGGELFTISLKRSDASFLLDGKVYRSVEELKPLLVDKINNTDASTALEKMLRERKAELEAIFNEDAFKESLKSSGLKINMTPREEYNKVIYDVTNTEGKVSFSFVVEMSSGMLKVIQDNQEIDLYTFLDSLGSKKKP